MATQPPLLFLFLLPFLFISATPTSGVEADAAVNDFVSSALNDFKREMKSGIPEWHVPMLDPLSIPDYSAHLVEDAVDVKVSMSEFLVEGLSTFETTSVETNLKQRTMLLKMFLPQLEAKASYSLKGRLFKLLPLYGEGEARIRINDLKIESLVDLSVQDDGHLNVDMMQVTIPSTGAFFCHLDDLLGGGSLGENINAVLGSVGAAAFEHLRPTLVAEMEKGFGKKLNSVFKEVALEEIKGGGGATAFSDTPSERSTASANSFVDSIIADIRPRISDTLDPVKLPEGRKGFERRLIMVTVRGEVKLYDGWLVGLSTLHRTGNAHMSNSSTGVVVIDGELGVSSLMGQYSAHAKFMDLGPSFQLSVTVPAVVVTCSVRQDFFQPGSAPVLAFFKIRETGKIDIKLKGSLGVLNWLFNKVASWTANLVKGFVARQIETPIRKLISEKLKDLSIPVEKLNVN